MALPLIVGLDIGTQSIRAAVAEIKRDNQLSLLSLMKMPSAGMRRGTVDNVVDATHAIGEILTELKKINKSAIKNIILGVATPDVKVQHSKGVVAVSRADDEIYQDDISRVIQSSQAINLPPNRIVLHYLTKEFIVDGIDNISDPLGMIGKRLEVNTLIIDAFSPSVKNIMKCIETLGGTVITHALSPIASACTILSKGQKELGVILIDIGFAKTSFVVYEENKLVHAGVIPVGSGNITNDLAIGLRIPIEAAEIVKLSYGSAIAKEVPARDIVDLNKIDARVRGTVSKKYIAEIIEVRLAEIFELVNNEIKHLAKAGQLPAGAVLVGGGAKLPNIVDLARSELKLAAEIGVPHVAALNPISSDIALQAEDPEFACALGLLKYEQEGRSDSTKVTSPQFGSWLKKILDSFIP